MTALLDDLGRIPLLSAEEEVDLAKRIEDGDEQARELMITANLRLVVWIAKRYQQPGMALADLVQEGVFGLMRAVDGFDWRKGHKFSTYATWWIRQRIQRAVHDQSRLIRLPGHVSERARAVERVERDLATELGREPTENEVFEAASLSQRHWRQVREAAKAVTSLEIIVGEDGTELGAFVAGPEHVENEIGDEVRAEELRRAITSLPERQRQVLELRYGLAGEEPLTLSQVGERLSVSRERVRQIEQRALQDLARRPEVEALREAV